MQKGTVCGASRSVYNLKFFFLGFLLHPCFEFPLNVHSYKGLAGTFDFKILNLFIVVVAIFHFLMKMIQH